ncbi:hypothetical protein E0H80_07960 [Acinetobacter sp. ANC 4779]|uniref:hypothetical protein n=1 Tax=Acinetobacter sp. ANC 4779 TaxID=2529848 RepID=UPI00103BA991|nr:hypothetical protein [Acinetobacter sp. ANC 4779]TCB50751.1 hypothetical protein E0H80_07960 [Acinetobacter sp. ANC 4779]
MKFHLLVVYIALMFNFAHAAQCLSASESKELNNIYQKSSEFYRHVKLDCESTDEIVQKNCNSPEHKKILEIYLRTAIYDYENTHGEALTGKPYQREYHSAFKEVTSSFDSCDDLKKSLKYFLSTSIWTD